MHETRKLPRKLNKFPIKVVTNKKEEAALAKGLTRVSTDTTSVIRSRYTHMKYINLQSSTHFLNFYVRMNIYISDTIRARAIKFAGNASCYSAQI